MRAPAAQIDAGSQTTSPKVVRSQQIVLDSPASSSNDLQSENQVMESGDNCFKPLLVDLDVEDSSQELAGGGRNLASLPPPGPFTFPPPTLTPGMFVDVRDQVCVFLFLYSFFFLPST